MQYSLLVCINIIIVLSDWLVPTRWGHELGMNNSIEYSTDKVGPTSDQTANHETPLKCNDFTYSIPL